MARYLWEGHLYQHCAIVFPLEKLNFYDVSGQFTSKRFGEQL